MEYRSNQQCNLEVVTQSIDLVRSDTGEQYFQGYALNFYDGTIATEYRPLPNVVERINRDAITEETLTSNDVELWYNHSPEFVLGSVKRNTLFLKLDNKGLSFAMPYDAEDVDHQKVYAKLKKGIATGASWQALATAKLERSANDTYVRTITKIERLKEISIVNNPAYKSTEVWLRNDLQRFERQQQFLKRAALY